ncbi:TPA: hypothetical protein VDB83_005868 [Burkholderia cenocepacia]|nr:hypothetical protein [Burkholderia cenocepacia]
MNSNSFLYALTTSGVYLNGRSRIRERLSDVHGWQKVFVELVLADHARVLLLPEVYGAEKWSEARSQFVNVLREYAFDEADVDRVAAAIHADSHIALVEFEILRLNGASAPDLPSHLFPGCGNDYLIFRIEASDTQLHISENAVAEAIVEIEIDAGLNEFDPDTRTGSYYVVDGSSTFSVGARFLMALNVGEEVTAQHGYSLEDYRRFDARDTAMVTAAGRGATHAAAVGSPVSERGSAVDQPPRVRVETLAGERTILIRERGAFALLRWPDYRAVRRLSVHKSTGHGETGFQIWSGRSANELSGTGDLVASCHSEGEALDLLAAIETAILAEAEGCEMQDRSPEVSAQSTAVAAPDSTTSPHWAVAALLGGAAVCVAIVAMPILFGAGDALAKRLFPDPRSTQAIHPNPPALPGPEFLAPPLQAVPTVPRGRVNG